MTDKKHAVLSPSSAYRWSRCPGSVVLERGYPNSDSTYSKEGTAAHELAELCLKEYPTETCNTSDAEAFIGRKAENGVEFTQTMAKHVQKYVDYCRQFISSSAFYATELRVPIDHVTGEADAEGSLDFGSAVHIGDGHYELHVVDLKYGMTPVDVADNDQLLLYALGLMKSLEILGLNITRVVTTIFQPRLPDFSVSGGTYTYTIKDMTEHFERLRLSAVEAQKQCDGGVEQVLVPGEKQCRWCRAKADCTAHADFVEEKLGAKFDAVIDDPEVINVKKRFDAASLGTKLDAVPMIETWCKAVRAAVEAELLQGRPVEGVDGAYKLVKGREGNRKWGNEADVEAAAKELKIKKSVLHETSLVSPTTAEELYEEEKLTSEQWEVLKKFIRRAKAGVSVASAKDKRPAFDPNEVEFEPVVDN